MERSERTDNGLPALQPIAHPGRASNGGGERVTIRGTWGTNIDTLGWSDCGCGAPFTPGTVLDPFAGTGTTLAVADLHGRDAIGIDIDARNPLLYEQRRAECARNLFDSPMPDANQLDLFGGVA